MYISPIGSSLVSSGFIELYSSILLEFQNIQPTPTRGDILGVYCCVSSLLVWFLDWPSLGLFNSFLFF